MGSIPSIQELVMLAVLVLLLNATGIWPALIKGLRDLRGDDEPEPQAQRPVMANGELDLCYRMLGLSPSATWDEVERAYRGKAKIHHPDKGGDIDTMRALNEAYERLKRARRG